MKKAVIIGITGIIVLLGVLINFGNKGNIKNALDTAIIENVNWLDAKKSENLNITCNLTLKYEATQQDPYLIYEILLKNKTNKPIQNLIATAFLHKDIAQFISTPLPTFGNIKDDKVDLVPNKIPYALAITRITQIPNYSSFLANQKDLFLKNLLKPIRLKITYKLNSKSQIEYLEINPRNINLKNDLQ